MSANFAGALPAIALRRGDDVALIVQGSPGQDDERTSWRALAARASGLAHGLRERGVRRGDRVCVFVRPGVEWLALIYALLWLGAVPVLIDPGMGRPGVARCVARIAPRVFVGIPRAHLLRVLSPGSFRTVELCFAAGEGVVPLTRSLAALARPDAGPFEPLETAPDDPAAVLFTSGSTGPAKGVPYTHGMLAAQREALTELYAFGRDEVDLACLPLFALYATSLEWTSVLPDLDVSRPATCDPARIVAAIQAHGVTNSFGSPAIWRRVAPWCAARGVKLESVRRLMIAGASVPPRLIAACRDLLGPQGDVHTPYGATEALPVASISGAEVEDSTRKRTESGKGVCVGRPPSGVELCVLPIHDGPIERFDPAAVLAPDAVGELCVKGRLVTAEYAFEPAHTAAAKIPDPRGGFWHRMGDVGYVDEVGRVWFLGRKSQRLETARGTLLPDGLEGVFDLSEHVARSALVGIGPRGTERPVLVVEPAAPLPRPRALRERLATEILRTALWHPACAVVEGVLFRDALPVDVRHNAKIDRGALKRWAEARAGELLPRRVP
ncbi:MAG TPA: fatty acid CoA ligase family protein [Planctomycetota bacterium]|nr:fatty acid CoA ligase family protein [Planctomycetota bacterium]